ncbi:MULTISPECIES: UDP-N-acetylglucosamine 1-carboxyvinyltransferase [unclassified Candidatus Frackibacter]|uniref:UDP-N-acetylglucosamine 1-carboxyvinyltransferase n=1 Tax=unclassified Candidatus Frackibacter TaxID=2648818 RepID=UPI00079C66A5|nr:MULTISPECIES: UDP-N-acetylglucosamine 1-carboxyvinyltransferase [unclassified Candidatus Frackibacter]KXS42464.1 MAG: UDP-N-acetylglucosamine 1-carboxyvinyltransferase [Candidatus Frackibacter sp. T328-2]SDC35018.1 UDP-N-acetylglucosamine 1-carboxyvinyltransferase [Candidatus Frackibacter sp. WG11]SEM56405.1 UDP-N-acetylglucosamine 1-carboxyvinyltransferase [Candidatus Frackibacter sp. WG12]SFL70902.1 UDP-N-acetylglucosamine 1-carboxyvinyltransferase [Candidatus Frackibacter sp. WG13]
MDSFIVKGGNRLTGEVDISGAKNAVLPILAGTVLSSGENIIREVPRLRDVKVMKEVLSNLGAGVSQDDKVITVNSSVIDSCEIPEYLMRKMRATIFLMGSLLARFKKVRISQPGGCSIGPRPIDLHIKGLEALGVEFTEEHGYLEGKTDELIGADIHLDFPSVGATENIMMAATKATGTTVIRNAAKEPEIIDLQNFLNGMGAKIRGAGTDIIKVEGVEELHSIDYTVIPDRIETGTFMVASAITGGEVLLNNVIPEHVEPVIAKLLEAGVEVDYNQDQIKVTAPAKVKGVNVKTLPYPGFPTDMQPQFMTLLSVAEGTSVITETIFENRLKHADELRRMGADIRIESRSAIIKGIKELSGAVVEASDLRAGAALVLAGLVAEGETRINDIYHIDRGYENLESKITNLGGYITRVSTVSV